MSNKGQWKTISSSVKYKSPYITVIEDEVIKPDGSEGKYSYVKTLQTLSIVPLDKKNNLYLCRQYRYIFKDYSLEIPRGFVDKGETIEQAARRELKEEAGVIADKVEQIGELRLSIGLIDEHAKVYLAQDLKEVKVFTPQANEISKVNKYPLEKVVQMIKEGEIKDGLTVGAVLLAKAYLRL